MLALRKWTILVHRYLGMALAPVFLLWFASGIGMLFTGGMPALDPAARLAHLPPIDFAHVMVDLDTAARGRPVTSAVLTSVLGRPAYRLGARTVIFADTGESLDDHPVAPADLAAAFLNQPVSVLGPAELLTARDQWTFSLRRSLPLYRFRVRDAARSDIYVSQTRGEVLLITTRASRIGAWLSAIPHWFYFKTLRERDALWAQVVIWTSGLGSISAVLGLVLAIVQFSPRAPFRLREITTYNPYAGWMRWHYVSGLFFGVFALTWVASGLLSMQPGDWAAGNLDVSKIQAALRGGPLRPAVFPTPNPAAWPDAIGAKDLKEIEFLQIEGEPHYALRGTGRPRLIAARSLQERTRPLDRETVVRNVGAGAPGVPIVDAVQLDAFDAYYYSRDASAPLPVIRVKLGDADRTWLYIDAMRGDIREVYGRRARLERWVYHGLHSLDFSFWYRNRALWLSGMIALSLGGIALSGAGTILAVRRIRRAARRRRR